MHEFKLKNQTLANIKKAFTSGLLAVFLYSVMAPSYAQASVWAERKAAVEKLKEDAKPLRTPQDTLLAQLPSINSGMLPGLTPLLKEQPSAIDSLAPLAVASHIPLANLKLPLAYSNFKSAHFPKGWKPGDLTVLHIQDVHLNKEAQENIAKSIQNLVDQGQVDFVALEGAFEPVDVSRFRAYPDKEAVQMVADYFLQEGKISGALHTALTSPNPIPAFVGVDDRKLYDGHVGAYKESAGKAEVLKGRLSSEIRKTDEEKANVFNPDLLAFDRAVQSYRKAAIPLGEYVRAVCARESPESGSVQTFLKALQMEESLDFENVEKERSALINKLAAELSKSQISGLLNMSLAYRLGKVRHKDFYVYLEDLCRKEGMALESYPAMKRYIRYVIVSDSINAEDFLRETQELEKAAYEKLAKTEREKQLTALSRRQYLIGNLLDFALSPEEWKEYKEAGDGGWGIGDGNGATKTDSSENVRKGGFVALETEGVSSDFSKPGAVDRHPPSPIPHPLSSFESFFEHAAQRDKALTENLLAQAAQKRAKLAVLVTGGYHSHGITQLLDRHSRERPLSYNIKGGGTSSLKLGRGNPVAVISLAPKITKIEGAKGTEYLSIFTQEKTPLEKLFQGERLFVLPEEVQFPSYMQDIAAVNIVGVQQAVSRVNLSDANERVHRLVNAPEITVKTEASGEEGGATVTTRGKTGRVSIPLRVNLVTRKIIEIGKPVVVGAAFAALIAWNVHLFAARLSGAVSAMFLQHWTASHWAPVLIFSLGSALLFVHVIQSLRPRFAGAPGGLKGSWPDNVPEAEKYLEEGSGFAHGILSWIYNHFGSQAAYDWHAAGREKWQKILQPFTFNRLHKNKTWKQKIEIAVFLQAGTWAVIGIAGYFAALPIVLHTDVPVLGAILAAVAVVTVPIDFVYHGLYDNALTSGRSLLAQIQGWSKQRGLGWEWPESWSDALLGFTGDQDRGGPGAGKGLLLPVPEWLARPLALAESLFLGWSVMEVILWASHSSLMLNADPAAVYVLASVIYAVLGYVVSVPLFVWLHKWLYKNLWGRPPPDVKGLFQQAHGLGALLALMAGLGVVTGYVNPALFTVSFLGNFTVFPTGIFNNFLIEFMGMAYMAAHAAAHIARNETSPPHKRGTLIPFSRELLSPDGGTGSEPGNIPRIIEALRTARDPSEQVSRLIELHTILAKNRDFLLDADSKTLEEHVKTLIGLLHLRIPTTTAEGNIDAGRLAERILDWYRPSLILTEYPLILALDPSQPLQLRINACDFYSRHIAGALHYTETGPNYSTEKDIQGSLDFARAALREAEPLLKRTDRLGRFFHGLVFFRFAASRYNIMKRIWDGRMLSDLELVKGFHDVFIGAFESMRAAIQNPGGESHALLRVKNPTLERLSFLLEGSGRVQLHQMTVLGISDIVSAQVEAALAQDVINTADPGQEKAGRDLNDLISFLEDEMRGGPFFGLKSVLMERVVALRARYQIIFGESPGANGDDKDVSAAPGGLKGSWPDNVPMAEKYLKEGSGFAHGILSWIYNHFGSEAAYDWHAAGREMRQKILKPYTFNIRHKNKTWKEKIGIAVFLQAGTWAAIGIAGYFAALPIVLHTDVPVLGAILAAVAVATVPIDFVYHGLYDNALTSGRSLLAQIQGWSKQRGLGWEWPEAWSDALLGFTGDQDRGRPAAPRGSVPRLVLSESPKDKYAIFDKQLTLGCDIRVYSNGLIEVSGLNVVDIPFHVSLMGGRYRTGRFDHTISRKAANPQEVRGVFRQLLPRIVNGGLSYTNASYHGLVSGLLEGEGITIPSQSGFNPRLPFLEGALKQCEIAMVDFFGFVDACKIVADKVGRLDLNYREEAYRLKSLRAGFKAEADQMARRLESVQSTAVSTDEISFRQLSADLEDLTRRIEAMRDGIDEFEEQLQAVSASLQSAEQYADQLIDRNRNDIKEQIQLIVEKRKSLRIQAKSAGTVREIQRLAAEMADLRAMTSSESLRAAVLQARINAAEEAAVAGQEAARMEALRQKTGWVFDNLGAEFEKARGRGRATEGGAPGQKTSGSSGLKDVAVKLVAILAMVTLGPQLIGLAQQSGGVNELTQAAAGAYSAILVVFALLFVLYGILFFTQHFSSSQDRYSRRRPHGRSLSNQTSWLLGIGSLTIGVALFAVAFVIQIARVADRPRTPAQTAPAQKAAGQAQPGLSTNWVSTISEFMEGGLQHAEARSADGRVQSILIFPQARQGGFFGFKYGPVNVVENPILYVEVEALAPGRFDLGLEGPGGLLVQGNNKVTVEIPRSGRQTISVDLRGRLRVTDPAMGTADRALFSDYSRRRSGSGEFSPAGSPLTIVGFSFGPAPAVRVPSGPGFLAKAAPIIGMVLTLSAGLGASSLGFNPGRFDALIVLGLALALFGGNLLKRISSLRSRVIGIFTTHGDKEIDEIVAGIQNPELKRLYRRGIAEEVLFAIVILLTALLFAWWTDLFDLFGNLPALHGTMAAGLFVAPEDSKAALPILERSDIDKIAKAVVEAEALSQESELKASDRGSLSHVVQTFIGDRVARFTPNSLDGRTYQPSEIVTLLNDKDLWEAVQEKRRGRFGAHPPSSLFQVDREVVRRLAGRAPLKARLRGVMMGAKPYVSIPIPLNEDPLTYASEILREHRDAAPDGSVPTFEFQWRGFAKAGWLRRLTHRKEARELEEQESAVVKQMEALGSKAGLQARVKVVPQLADEQGLLNLLALNAALERTLGVEAFTSYSMIISEASLGNLASFKDWRSLDAFSKYNIQVILVILLDGAMQALPPMSLHYLREFDRLAEIIARSA